MSALHNIMAEDSKAILVGFDVSGIYKMTKEGSGTYKMAIIIY